MGMKGIRPNQIAAERELAERAEKAEGSEGKGDKSKSGGRPRAKRTAAAATK
jgi:hypothetical protein